MKVLIAFLTLVAFVNPLVFSDTGSEVTVTISPEVLTAGNPFTITLLVDYPIPEDVSVTAPSFPGSLSLDRFIRVPRVIGAGLPANERADNIKTSIEFRLIPNSSGQITLGSFLITTPQGASNTGVIILNILGGTQESAPASIRLLWEGFSGSPVLPRQITAGERLTLTLRANSSPLPPPAFFMPEVPQGVILSQSVISSQEREAGIVLKLVLIPLVAGSFNLPARVLQYENKRFEIPELNIRVISR